MVHSVLEKKIAMMDIPGREFDLFYSARAKILVFFFCISCTCFLETSRFRCIFYLIQGVYDHEHIGGDKIRLWAVSSSRPRTPYCM